MRRGIERLYAYSGVLNDKGQYSYYGKVDGCLLTGNEDGLKHCAMSILFSLQHIGYTIPHRPMPVGSATSGPARPIWTKDSAARERLHQPQHHIHDVQPHPPGGDVGAAGGIPARGNQRSEWDAGCRPDYGNPERR
jgi:hypothetical protein